MTLFANVQNDADVEKAEDTLGSGGFVKESNIYIGDIKVVYITETANGAMAFNLEVALEDGSDYRETIYPTNRKGQTFYERNGRKLPLPGFTRANDICLITTEKELLSQDHEMKTLMIWDGESQKEVPREVPVLIELTGQKVALAIQKIRENKNEFNQSTNSYEPTNEERVFNNVAAVFHPEMKVTVNEAMDGKDPEFWDKWLERNEGELYDRFKEVSASGRPASGRPVGGASTSDAPKRASMFAKK